MFGSDRDRALRPVLVIASADPLRAARFARYFRRLGWEVHPVAGAEEAVRAVQVLAPQVVLVDEYLADAQQIVHPKVLSLTADEPEAVVERIYGRRLAEAV